jgi:hypothetical protein
MPSFKKRETDAQECQELQVTEKGSPPLSAEPLAKLVEPTGIEPVTSTMPLSQKSTKIKS